MLNKRILCMIDELFADMKMSAENLALRDELISNAQARYEDNIRQGKSEEDAFAEVAASLGDVQSLLHEMNDGASPEKEAQADVPPQEQQPGAQPDPKKDAPQGCATDIGDALNKAFSVLGGLGQQFVPQAKKIVREADKATGGVIGDLGKAVGKGMREAQKVAGETIDKLSDSRGEIVVNFGKDDAKTESRSPQDLREAAKDMRAQAQIKQVTDDQEGARDLRRQAYDLETQADALEQALDMAAAQRDAQRQVEEDAKDGQGDDVANDAQADIPADIPTETPTDSPKEPVHQTVIGADGEIDEDAFSRVVEEMTREADAVTGTQDAAHDAPFTAHDAPAGTVMIHRFPAAGLRKVDIKLDADDVFLCQSESTDIEVSWEATQQDAEPVVTMDGHDLVIRRRNPDLFKTFFSVFKKEGGKVIVRVPRGYAADYKLSTTSGDIELRELDVDKVQINSTSGDVLFLPDAGIRAKEVDVTTVSGNIRLSACAGDVDVTTVSGDQFISCDANKVDVNVVSGKVHVEGACETWEVNSVSGDVKLLCTVAPTRKIEISTMSGSAQVSLPEDIRGFVAQVSGLSGSIVNEFGPNRYGTCALPIQMETMSGKLMITRL